MLNGFSQDVHAVIQAGKVRACTDQHALGHQPVVGLIWFACQGIPAGWASDRPGAVRPPSWPNRTHQLHSLWTLDASISMGGRLSSQGRSLLLLNSMEETSLQARFTCPSTPKQLNFFVFFGGTHWAAASRRAVAGRGILGGEALKGS